MKQFTMMLFIIVSMIITNITVTYAENADSTNAEAEMVIDTNQVTDMLDVMNWLENVLEKSNQDQAYSFYEPNLHKRVCMLQSESDGEKVLEVMFWDNDYEPIQYIAAKIGDNKSVFDAMLKDELGIATWPDPQKWGNIIPDSIVENQALRLKLLMILDCDCDDE